MYKQMIKFPYLTMKNYFKTELKYSLEIKSICYFAEINFSV